MTELVLNNGDIPWEVLKRRGFESVRLMELTRFYLQLKEDPHGPNVALFVGNLPPNLKQKEYETILLEYLDEGIYTTFHASKSFHFNHVFSCSSRSIHIHRSNLL